MARFSHSVGRRRGPHSESTIYEAWPVEILKQSMTPWGWKKKGGHNAAPALDLSLYCMGINAIPCGLTIPVTTLVMTPVLKLRLPTEFGVAVYAASGEKIFLEIA